MPPVPTSSSSSYRPAITSTITDVPYATSEASSASSQTSSASSSSASVITSGHEDAVAVAVDARLQQQQPARRGLLGDAATRARVPAPSSPDRRRTRSRASRRARARRRSAGTAPATRASVRGSSRRSARARSTSRSSSKTSRTASAAACATGLPTKVPPTPPSPGASMISALPSTPESGRPAAIDFATMHQVGLDPVMLDREHLPGAPEPGLDLVDDHHDAVAVADARGRPATNSCGATMKPPSPWTARARSPRPSPARPASAARARARRARRRS